MTNLQAWNLARMLLTELFRASWVRGGIAKILPNRTMNAVLVQGLLWDGF